MTAPAFEGWCVLELLGHRVRYGMVSEVTAFGEAFARIEMPTDPPTVELYSGKAIYGVRPASEATIRAYHSPRRELAAATPPQAVDGEYVDAEDRDDEVPVCALCERELGDSPLASVALDVADMNDRELWHADCARGHADQTLVDYLSVGMKPAVCGACYKPLGDVFVSVNLEDERDELWHPACAAANASPTEGP